MFDLFLSEFKRYRLVALAAYFLQILCWIIIGKMMIILKPIYFTHAILMLCALSAGVGIGAVQMLLHKRKNHWTYLIHRPLSMSKIHLALSAAALCVIFAGFIFPFVSVVAYLDLMTNNVVDVRHYLMCVEMMLIAATAYFITTYAVLSPSKLVIMSLWMVAYLCARNTIHANYMLLNAAIFCGLSFYMSRSAFKIDLSIFSSKKSMIVLMSVAMQPLLFWILGSLQAVYYHVPMGMMGIHPNKDLTKDSYYSFVLSDTKQQFAALLAKSDSDLAPALNRQLSLAKFKSFGLRKRVEVTKGQLFTSDRGYEIWGEDNTIWVFSHDKMVFEGRSMKTDEHAGLLTRAGFVAASEKITPQQQFEYVPNIISSQYIYTQNTLFNIDFKAQKITPIYTLSGDEIFAGSPVSAFDLTLLRTNKRLVLFNKTDFSTASSLIEPLHSVNLPIALENNMHIEISQMTDGYLFLFSSSHFFGFEEEGSELIYVTHDNDITSLAVKQFNIRHQSRLLTEQYFTLSPIVSNVIEFSLGRILTTVKTTPESMKYFWQRSYPPSIWAFCIGMALFSALITLIIAKRLPMSPSNRWLWVALSLIGALPALIAFLIINDWRDALRNDFKQEAAHV